MEEEAAVAEQQKALKRAAIREHERKHRAVNNPSPAPPRQPPMSSQERSQKYRLKKKQQRQALTAIRIADANPQDIPLVRKTTLAERTRRYRQRLNERRGYIKGMPLSKSERNRRFYAKAQQRKLESQMAEAGGIQVRSDCCF